jgi:hypothetical protein
MNGRTLKGCQRFRATPEMFSHPFRVHIIFYFISGGLRQASTTGYYLSRFQREN